MHPLLREYRLAGCYTDSEVLSVALSRGPAAFNEARALVESGRENSTAMVIVPGTPPGKNVCAFIRRLVGERSKLIVAAKPGGLPAGSFERMLRASMPDVEKKLRIMDVGNSVAEAVMSAERNRHYRPSQALEIFADEQEARNFSQEVRDGSLNFDPTVISVVAVEVPSDDSEAISQAAGGDDLSAQHRVLDPHIFSSPDGLMTYRGSMAGQSDPRENKKSPPERVRQVNELVGTQAAPQAGPQSSMRASNSSAWSGGRLTLKNPVNHVPEDDNESERDRTLDQDIVGGGLDWGLSRNRGSV